MLRGLPLRIVAGAVLTAGALFPQAPAPAPAFEVASVKLAPPLNPADVAAGKIHVGMIVDGARVDIGFFSLADLIPLAYKVKRYQVEGPDWMTAQRFDIQAKIPDGVSKDLVPDMLQGLLVERFKLTMHREKKDHGVFALVVGKGGLKLKDSPPDPDPPSGDSAPGADAAAARPQIRLNRDGAVVNSGRAGTTRMTMGANGMMHMEVTKMTLAQFADVLSPFLDRPVVDMTELKGNYQFALDLSMDDLRKVAKAAGVALPGATPSPAAAGQPADAASDPSGGSIFTSVQQLGLKLEPRKEPVETIVVDHLEKAPSEN